MSFRECCVDNCFSSSSREEDLGVSYHRFPKHKTVREAWIAVTRKSESSINYTSFVCSRHFRKNDFDIIKDSKYILKSDAIPSIFPWTLIMPQVKSPIDTTKDDLADNNTHTKSGIQPAQYENTQETDIKDLIEISNLKTHVCDPKTNYADDRDLHCENLDEKNDLTHSGNMESNNLQTNSENIGVNYVPSSNENVEINKDHTNSENIEINNDQTNSENMERTNVHPNIKNVTIYNEQTNSENMQKKSNQIKNDKTVVHNQSDANDVLCVQEPDPNPEENENTNDTCETTTCDEKDSSNDNSDITKVNIRECGQEEIEFDESKNNSRECDQGEITFDDSGNQGENLEAIKKIIAEQEREIKELQAEIKPNKNVDAVKHAETAAIASSVIDIIMSASEAKMDKTKDSSKAITMPNEKANSSMALSVGSKVEAKDFANDWCPAQVLEVDYDEMEVLVHYETAAKVRHDEWICVSSPRLRPLGSPSQRSPETAISYAATSVNFPPSSNFAPSSNFVPSSNFAPSALPSSSFETMKQEEKPKIEFNVGDRCLARWRDNRKFLATVNAKLEDGQYEIIFDDGFCWKCNVNRLSKMKDSIPEAPFMLKATPPLSSPVAAKPKPTTSQITSEKTPLNTTLPFHTHLFDPSLDYLGSKRERREKKRKLNIKEIFNIGQKKTKKDTEKVQVKQEKVVKKSTRSVAIAVKKSVDIKAEIKTELPDAVASILGTAVVKDEVDNKTADVVKEEESVTQDSVGSSSQLDTTEEEDKLLSELKKEIKIESSTPILQKEPMINLRDILKEPRIILKDSEGSKEPIKESNVTEEPIKDSEESKELTVGKTEPKSETSSIGPVASDNLPENSESTNVSEQEPMEYEVIAVDPNAIDVEVDTQEKNKKRKYLNRIRKARRIRLMQERKVKREVERVKNELEEMKRQVEEMKKQVLREKYSVAGSAPQELPAGCSLLPGEWAVRWVNGQPVGTVSELEADSKDSNKPALPRRSVQVEDNRLPPGWTKHMVRRSMGSSAGKWDVVLVSPDNKRIHTKNEMRHYLEMSKDPTLASYESFLFDFGVHRKLSKRLGWDSVTESGDVPQPVIHTVNALSFGSPLVKLRRLNVKKEMRSNKNVKKARKKLKRNYQDYQYSAALAVDVADPEPELQPEHPPLEDGYVYVGSLKVQMIENLLRCPAEGCFKNFRNNTLLQMHIKHYHRELRKMMGATPKVLDLASARTKTIRLKNEVEQRPIKVKINRRRHIIEDHATEENQIKPEYNEYYTPTTPVKDEPSPITQDSPKLRDALISKPIKRPKVLLPVRRPDEPTNIEPETEEPYQETDSPIQSMPYSEPLDFESAISTHTVTKPLLEVKKKSKKKFAIISKFNPSEDEEWGNSDVDTRSSYQRSGTPDSKTMDKYVDTPPQLMSSGSNEENKDSNFMLTENGERIKIVRMKREEIINCHCGFREEDGLMIQCELCLCWQHALCHNIQKEAEVPDKYTCSICLNPRRGRRSQRFLHDQDRMYEGLLPSARPSDSLRRSHELSGNLIRIEGALHALRVKYYVAVKKDHPKLYLWAKDWESSDSFSQERLNADYVDMNAMISDIGKENLPLKTDDMKDMSLNDIRTPPSSDVDIDRLSQRDSSQLGSQALLSGLLSSPGSLDLPISTSDLEKLAKSVQVESEGQPAVVPQPEAAIENSVCRERLLRHIQRCQALIDARLDSIEAQVAELESRHPSFEDDETPEYFPRTKQTIQMLLRDLENMEELGLIS